MIRVKPETYIEITVLLKYIKIELDTNLKKILLNQDLINYVECLSIDDAFYSLIIIFTKNCYKIDKMFEKNTFISLSKFFHDKKFFL